MIVRQNTLDTVFISIDIIIYYVVNFHAIISAAVLFLCSMALVCPQAQVRGKVWYVGCTIWKKKEKNHYFLNVDQPLNTFSLKYMVQAS